ncbi:MAG: hypothetical protein L0K49_10190, partial [Lactococcus lactis]|nr:hypothetical protein [Lactococcus lactis]
LLRSFVKVLPSGSAGKNSSNFWNVGKTGGVLRHPPMWLSGHLVKLPFIAGVAWSKNDQIILKKMVVVKKKTQNRL